MRSRARWSPTPFAIFVVSLVLVTVACAPSDEAASGPGEDAAPAANPSEAPAGEPAGEAWLGEVRVGDALDPEGGVPADHETDRFAPGDSIYVSMAIEGAPANAAVHAVFYDGSGEKIAEDEKKVPAEARFLYFDGGDTSNWLPGEYRVDLAVDGEVRSTREITIAEGAPEAGEDAAAAAP